MHKHLFILIALVAFLKSENAFALSRFAGRQLYFTLLTSNHKFPIFTKEFSEGQEIPTVGGRKELFLTDQQRTLGIRIGYDNIRNNRSGLGMSLTYWRTEFEDEAFSYDIIDLQRQIAEYRTPTHSLLFLDLNGLVIPWETKRNGIGLYILFSFISDWEKYYLDTYSTTGVGTERIGLESNKKIKLSLRYGFGVGTRYYFSRLLSFWLEKRWIAGEKFSSASAVEEGGFISREQEKRLYAPITSLGLAISFQ